MRAIEFHGDERLEVVERPDPTPGSGELLIAPSAVGICGTDVEIFEGSLAYFRMGLAEYPIVPGHEWTGVVVDVGAGVTGFAPGDRVVGEVAIGCGVCTRCRAGRHHLCARRTETGIVHMDGAMASRMVFPSAFAHRVDLGAHAAALVEPTSVALHAVRRGDVAGKGVLVVGAGPIGLLVAQCARAEGAADVVISDTRADRLDVAAALGVATTPARPPIPPSPTSPRPRARWRPVRSRRGWSARTASMSRSCAPAARRRSPPRSLRCGPAAASSRSACPGRRRSRSTSTGWSSATSTSSACWARSATGRARSRC